MKSILLGICALGLVLGATIKGTTAIDRPTLDQATGLPLPDGYCALDPLRAGEAEMLRAASREARLGGVQFVTTAVACNDLAAWRRGTGALLRMASYFEVPEGGAGDWGFDATGDEPWRGDVLTAALESGLHAVRSGRAGGDIGLQARIGAARYRVALEPVALSETGLRFVGLTLAGLLETPQEGATLLLIMSEPYRQPSQVLALLDLQRESLGRVRQVRAEQTRDLAAR